MTTKQATDRPGRGWEQLIDQINSATDDLAFLGAMLQAQCMIVAADYGAIWVIDSENKPQLVETSPASLRQPGPHAATLRMLESAAANGLSRDSSLILKLHPGEDSPSGPSHAKSLVFVTVMRSRGRIAAVSTVVADSQDARVPQITQPMRELAAGLYEGFESRRDANEFRLDAQRVRDAMALLAVSQDGRGFRGACLNLVNELTRQHQCSRVSLGWIKGQAVRVVAMSDTENLKRHGEQVALVEMAMSECLDQQQPIIYPVPENTEPLLSQAVFYSHRRLTNDHPNRHTLSIPLRNGEKWLGVLLLERPDLPFGSDLIRTMQLCADVITPHLDDRKQGDRHLALHTWDSIKDAGSYLVGPKHVAWKLAAAALIGVLTFSVFGTWQYRVSAPFILEAKDKRIVPSPYGGRLDLVRVEPGMVVKKGDLLAQLDTTDLKLQLAEATSQQKVTSLEQSKATAEGKQAEAQQAQAKIDQVQARIDLLQYHISRAAIRSPVDGVVLSGYWYDKVGGVVDQGKPMFEVAPIKNLVALVRVGETDIDQIDTQDVLIGQMATRSMPEEKFTIQVTRIVPMASPVEGVNVFEIRCRIDEPADWLRPGMEGLAKIEVGPRRIIWIFTHKIINTVRLWLWL